jgi:periplasmic protein TonB
LLKNALAVLFILTFPLPPAHPSQEAEKPPPSTQDATPPKPSTPRVRIDTKIMDKQLKRKVTPDYPKDALHQRIQGTVCLHIIVGTDGKVLQAEVISGHPLLAQAALDAVRRREYKPVLLNGVPVEVDTTVATVFSLAY